MKAFCIVIPAHNEAVHISSCIRAVHAAVDNAPSGLQCHLVMVLDACTDESEAIAHRLLRSEDAILRISCRNVGAARARGVAMALARLKGFRHDEVWLAGTDADSAVPLDWVRAQTQLARRGAGAVAGTVRVSEWGSYSAEGARAYEEFYSRAPKDDGPHIHGANLGVRADFYRRAGGFKASATGEDVALWHSLANTGAVRVSTDAIAVTTSARRAGRAPLGFASFLSHFMNAHHAREMA